MNAAVEVEWLKFRHARTALVTTVIVVVILPLMAGAFYAVRDADSNSPVAAKAKAMVIGEGWQGYTSLINQGSGGVGDCAAMEPGRSPLGVDAKDVVHRATGKREAGGR